jgi:hypothetical protein
MPRTHEQAHPEADRRPTPSPLKLGPLRTDSAGESTQRASHTVCGDSCLPPASLDLRESCNAGLNGDTVDGAQFLHFGKRALYVRLGNDTPKREDKNACSCHFFDRVAK